jgi:hypothetical protein
MRINGAVDAACCRPPLAISGRGDDPDSERTAGVAGGWPHGKAQGLRRAGTGGAEAQTASVFCASTGTFHGAEDMN